jgi:hypothetical protein
MMNLYFGDMLPPTRELRAERQGEHVLVGTASPVQLEVRTIAHHLTPDGTSCIGTFHDGRSISRCAIPEESVEEFLEMELFKRPVSLALNVRRGGPGLEGSLLALVPMEAQLEEAEEEAPWKSSVPGAGYEEAAGLAPEEGQLVGIFLGQIVRFDKDRRNPGNLLREAADMLAGIIRGQVGSVVDRVIQDLTDSTA